MTRRAPPEPEQCQWHDIVARSSHNGGWAGIMHCRRMLHHPVEYLDEVGAFWIRERLTDLLRRHGEPPMTFARAWLLSAGSLYWWLLHDHPTSRHFARMLIATRALWREIYGKPEQLALPSPNDTPAAPNRRRATRPASAGRHLQATETYHA